MTSNQDRTMTELPNLPQEAFEELYEETKKAYADLCEEVNKFEEGVKYTPEQEAKWLSHAKAWNLLQDLEVENLRRREKMGELTVFELEEMAHNAYRRVKRMENYMWDIVCDSSPGNQRGFRDEVNYWEILEAAANLEIDRRLLIPTTNSSENPGLISS